MSRRVGFIGLGNQGKPIAAHLAPSGFETLVYDIDPKPIAELIQTGARSAKSPQEVGAGADIVGICVPEDRHVQAVTLGENGLLSGMQSGGVIAVHSTILPKTASELAEAAKPRGVTILDACVTGGAARATQKTLTYLVGGSAEALEKARPFLECSAERIIHAGPVGSGAKLKLCINLITYIQWAAAFESATLAKSAGLSLDVLQEAGKSNGQITPMMMAYMSSQDMPEEARNNATYQRFMLNNTRIAEKDLAWALQLARQGEVSLPVGGLVSQLMGKLYGLDDGPRA